jgi:predicted nucleic acid-binding protein
VLVDTDVLIWNLRGNAKAAAVLDGLAGLTISSVSYMELIQGMRNREELRALRRALQFWDARIVHLDEAMSNRACFLVEEHFLSRSLGLADALIASTAIELGMPLLSGNAKHYDFIEGLALEVFRP